MKKFLLILSILILSSCSNSHKDDISNIDNSTIQNVDNSQSASIVGDQIASDPAYYSCIESAKYSCGINFINSYVQTNSSTDICDNFGDDSLRLACREMVIIETAKKTLDLDRCRTLTDSDKQATCIQSVITTKGIKESDPTVCSNYILSSTDIDTLENMKDRCVIHIIEQLEPTIKTKGLCGLIINEEARVSCENRIDSYLNTNTQNN